MDQICFENLTGWGPTKATLHAYSRVLTAVPRMWLTPHPKWWHISLQVRSDGLATREMPGAGGAAVRLRLDLVEHAIVVEADTVRVESWDLRAGLTANQLAEAIFRACAALGVSGEPEQHRFADASARVYDPEAATRFFHTIRSIDKILNQHRLSLPGDTGPVQFWSHGFDLAFEWFGDRLVRFEANGELKESRAQLNFGWAPGDSSHSDPYFYSNPWPFEEKLVEETLPAGARWFLSAWKGTLFPYRVLAGDPHAARRLLGYWQRVFEISRPALTRSIN